MTHSTTPVNTVAPLANVSLCMRTIKRAIDRAPHLPGLVVFYGPSGFGKSTAAGYVSNKLDAVYVACKGSTNRKALYLDILKEMGIKPAATIYEMEEQITQGLCDTDRPLIIDEVDYLVKKKSIECIRDIYEGSLAPILLIGEEELPTKLERWERIHGRVLDWAGAVAVTLEDVAHLAHLYCPEIDIDERLLVGIHEQAKGSVRRVTVPLDYVLNKARTLGISKIGLEECSVSELPSGKPTSRRKSWV